MLAELGFDGLTCIALTPAAAGNERTVELWSSAPQHWAQRYRACSYADVDPRVRMTEKRMSPVIWDAADVDDGWHVRRFLANAALHGVRSGFAVSFRDASLGRFVVAFDCRASPLNEAHCAAIVTRLGDLMLLAAALHERVFRPRCVAPGAKPGTAAGGLTTRERECLRMAASGLTSADMGCKLGIAERTVNFHMRNALRKLDAINRPEAIANALARGVLAAGASLQRSA
jgi:DNA-binding CsgD family transcriptional regulator